MARLLVIEDDRDIARLVALHLQDAGHEVRLEHGGESGLERALGGAFDLVVLDLMLPGLGGLELCRHLRAQKPEVLVLMLTARSSEGDRVLGLETGADDYLSKPFSLRELQARVMALLRRRQVARRSGGEPERLILGNLRLELERREVWLGERELQLTAKEFDLLLQFARHPGKVYRRAELLELVWGAGYDGLEHTVNSHINRLRAKLEDDPAKPGFIQTVWGVGYKFRAES